MGTWANFYILMGTAAATLIGLMFIAVTFGAKLVTHETVGIARGILSPILFHFSHVFFVAGAFLVPTESNWPVGICAIGASLVRIVGLPNVVRQLRKASKERHDIELSDWAFGVVLPIALYLLSIAGGAALLNGAAWASYVIASSVMGLLILGVVSAWDMLVWMASQV